LDFGFLYSKSDLLLKEIAPANLFLLHILDEIVKRAIGVFEIERELLTGVVSILSE
jgi:hypothetical protein